MSSSALGELEVGLPKSGARAQAVRLFLLFLPSLLATAVAAQTDSGSANPHGDLSTACSDCHSTTGWVPLIDPLPFDHSATGFALAGMHDTVECMTCHQDLVLANIGSACADCHIDPHLGSLGFDCERCHGTQSRDPRFGLVEFHDTTRFALTGAHRSLDCLACHGDGDPPFDYSLAALDCLDCHSAELQTAVPDHLAGSFSESCETCHRTDAWEPVDVLVAALDHDVFFPLRGAHAPADCTACHVEVFGGTPRDCVACHQPEYLTTRDPDHAALDLSTDCERCHSSDGWEGATEVEHDRFFPLNGVHAVLGCEECHGSAYAGTPTTCAPCHQADFIAIRDPDHQALGLSLDCEACHGELGWQVDVIDHQPFYPLRGAHVGPDCAECHSDGFTATSSECYSCHAEDYLAAQVPDHSAAGFAVDCEECHSEVDWLGTTFDHSFFPHEGGHAGLACTDCHDDGQFAGRSRECVACHRDDLDVAEPDHIEAGFPEACELCHDIFSWQTEAVVEHDFFPLRLGHDGLECLDCHVTGGFDDADRECYSCHAADYQGARIPDHQVVDFPVTCEDCHAIGDWETARFDHDSQYYPIYNGSHSDVWDSCTTCHLDPGDYAFFECLLCHDHNQRDMDAEHRGVEGYEYVSEACLTCHSIPVR